MNVIQIREDMPFDPQGLTGYTMTTDAWKQVVGFANMVIAGDRVVVQQPHHDALSMDKKVEGMKDVSERHGKLMGLITITDDATPVEFAEWSMALNHMGWFLHSISEQEESSMSEVPMRVMFALWEEAHDRAIKTLEARDKDQLMQYLRLVD